MQCSQRSLLGRWLTLRIKPMGFQILVNPLLCQPGLLRGWLRRQRLGRRRRWAGLVLLSLGQHPNLKDAWLIGTARIIPYLRRDQVSRGGQTIQQVVELTTRVDAE